MKSSAPRTLRRSTLALGIAATLLSSSSLAQTGSQTDAQTNTQSSSQPATPNPCKPTQRTQPASSPAPHPPCLVKHKKPDTSISLGAFSQLTIDRTADLFGFTVQSTAPSTGTLGTFRQTFNSWLGYSVNLGYSRVSEQYRSADFYDYPGSLNINSNMYESSVTYIAHTSVNKRLSLFGDLGPGLITFLPVPGGLVTGLSVQVRPTGVFGSGIDLHLSRHFDFRSEYRGLAYNNPDFRTGDTLSKRVTLTSEPTFSLVYHIHQTKP